MVNTEQIKMHHEQCVISAEASDSMNMNPHQVSIIYLSISWTLLSLKANGEKMYQLELKQNKLNKKIQINLN